MARHVSAVDRISPATTTATPVELSPDEPDPLDGTSLEVVRLYLKLQLEPTAI